MNLRRVVLWSLGVVAACGASAFAEDAGAANAKAAAKAAPVAARQTEPPPTCLTETGSRIKPKPGQCLNVAGRSYSHDELQSTGEVNLDDALSHLDPSITPGP